MTAQFGSFTETHTNQGPRSQAAERGRRPLPRSGYRHPRSPQPPLPSLGRFLTTMCSPVLPPSARTRCCWMQKPCHFPPSDIHCYNCRPHNSVRLSPWKCSGAGTLGASGAVSRCSASSSLSRTGWCACRYSVTLQVSAKRQHAGMHGRE